MIALFDEIAMERGYHSVRLLAQVHEARVRLERHEQRAQSSPPAALGAVGGPPRRIYVHHRDGGEWINPGDAA